MAKDASAASGDARRTIPSVDRLLQTDEIAGLLREHPHDLVVGAVREVLAGARAERGSNGRGVAVGTIVAAVETRIGALLAPGPRRVINATGVILHTNLGRAPLSAAAVAAMERVSRGYSALEYDLERGERGSRHDHATALLRQVTGAEDALVVNNNASAVLLALTALASGSDVIISRGQLVEIGGGFRIPDVLAQSGATLVEVGTTNRTYLEDYAFAVSERSAVLLRVHSSNYRIVGFVHTVALDGLVRLGAEHAIPVVDDLGSGCLLPTERFGLAHEPTVQESVRAGADLVCFSGDKLLGGPQSGIVVGRAEPIALLRRHPLMRAVRPDKASLAGLAATLVPYLRGEAEREIPVWRMIAAPLEEIDHRARQIAAAAGDAIVVESQAAIGGGSTPGETLPSRAVAIGNAETADELSANLRHWKTPIVARIADGRVLLDLRTVAPEEDPEVIDALREIGTMGANGVEEPV